MNLNEVTLAGQLGKAPEVIKSENGKATFVTCDLATNEAWKKDGETVTRTEWHKIELSDGAAEFAATYCSVGDNVFVRGKLRTRQWETNEGEKRTAHVVKASRFEILCKKKDKQESNDGEATAQLSEQ